jgi:dynein heavy chain
MYLAGCTSQRPPPLALPCSLDKASLGELKSFGSPAAEVVQVRRGSVAVQGSLGHGEQPPPQTPNPSSRPHTRQPATPPPSKVVAACMVLTAAGGKIPKDLSWAAGKKFMGNVDAFLKMLLSFGGFGAGCR